MDIFFIYLGTVAMSAFMYFIVYLVYGKEFSSQFELSWLIVGILFPFFNWIIAGFFCGSALSKKVINKLDDSPTLDDVINKRKKKE